MIWFWIVLFAVPAAAIMYDKWPRTGLAEYHHESANLHHDMERRGLSPAQMAQERAFRYAMVRTRRLVSEAVLRDPGGYSAALDRIASDESKRMALTDRDAAFRFLRAVKNSPDTDILYDDAIAARTAHYMRLTAQWKKHEITEDDIAAVRTIR